MKAETMKKRVEKILIERGYENAKQLIAEHWNCARWYRKAEDKADYICA